MSEAEPYGGPWMPWNRKTRQQLLDEAIAGLAADLAHLRESDERRQDETPQEAQGEARQRGAEGIRPESLSK